MDASPKEFRHGWPSLLGATLGLACGVGNYTSITSLFFRALEREFHWSKGAAAIALVALPVTAIFLPLAGRLVDRYGVRLVAGVSAILLGAAFFALSQMKGSLPAFYLGFIAFNVLGCGTSPVSYTRTIAQHFTLSRGVAMAIALSGVALAGILLPPVLGPVLGRGDWRLGYQILAGIAAGGGLLAVALIGRSPSGALSHRRHGEGLTLAQALKSSTFWVLSGAILFVAAASVGFVSQLQSVAVEAGVPIQKTIPLLSLVSLSVLIARVASGWALDAFKPEAVASSVLVLSAIGMIAWLFVSTSLIWALVGSVLLGVCVGAEYAFLSFFCARLFGLKAYGAIFGALAVSLYCGMALGGVFFGVMHDLTGNYRAPIVGAALALLVSGALFHQLRRAPASNALEAVAV